ncbi:MAG TPA: L-glutamate gamma-semialdehyde dehydrogenase [Chryseolinea sp.]|jgi:1-pyrroline-5-carboxylate dehydrogenase|nr:L-glutamate gamma-semialdehyde dehydrogenase [Chryseolinea sp.]
MANGFFNVPFPKNEVVLNYAPGSNERRALEKAIDEIYSNEVDVPMYIGAEEVRTETKQKLSPPYDHQRIVGYYSEGDREHVTQAIDAALAAKPLWSNLSWESRAAIFLKAADLLAGPYRYKINAATMVGQSKNCYQAEIDSACELIDFLRFNVYFMSEIYRDQPASSPGVWNRMEYRSLEGFTFALTPFNFTAIAGNLPTSMAMMGNTVVWKPAHTQILSANIIMQVLKQAGLPDGVVNLIYADGPTVGELIFNHRDFAGIHFTGSTGVFQKIWQTIGQNIHKYKSYPRIVGETGGKDFILAHRSANAKEVSTAISRGAFEFQGQKCSAASRCYIPSNLWDEVKKYLIEDLKSFKMGSPEDFGNFINAVIDEKAFNSITRYIDEAKKKPVNEIIAGGKYDKSKGYFVEPTVIVSKDPASVTMCEEIFGPVVTIYIYQEDNFEETMDLVDRTSPYALTGSIFAKDRYAIELATQKLTHAAGNFYINDKPTGAVVGQQPFGGARGSGTNDKAGAKVNLLRWVSLRTIKETFVTPTDYRYPFLEKE